MRHSFFKTILLLTAFFISSLTVQAQYQALEGIEEYIKSGMSDWEIPGMSVSVVKDGEVVFAEGFGIRKLGESERVDVHTLFGIASTTKAMTAATLAILVDEGKLHWDDPVVKYLPDFKLYDPYVTANVTIRDLLTHRTGIGRMTGNRIQYMPFRERPELIYRMRYMEPEAPFRERYVYSNMAYMVAGEVVYSVSGMSWDDFIANRIFEPLGMSRTNTSITQIADNENAAWPHQEIKGEVVTIPRRNFDNVGASASVNSSAYEMAKWMLFNLGKPGELDGKRLISEQTMAELYRPVTAIAGSNREAPVSSYALGWSVTTYNGYTLYRHGGATDGMNTNLIIIPEKNLGIFITTNVFNRFMTALGNEIVDRFMGLESTDWNAMILRGYQNQKARVQSLRDEIHSQRVTGTNTSRSLSAYEGVYLDNLYDNVEVKLGENGLELHFWDDETQIADLEHWHYDTFRAVWRNPAQREKFVHFTMGRDGQPNELHVTFTLRPMLLQVGIYPTNYYRDVRFVRQD